MHPCRKTREKLLLGPGPSPVESRVLRAMAEPTLGHLDGDFVALMDETQRLLRKTFATENPLTVTMPGTGSAGMEAACVNVIERGDQVIIADHGVFGRRMQDVAERCGAEVIKVSAPFGQALPEEELIETIRRHPEAKLVGVVHAETSTGVLQNLDRIAPIVHDAGMLFLVDAVTSLGGMEVPVDRLGLDIVYSGSQKCLGCPPGLAPLTLSPRAVKVVQERKTKVQSWYLDLTMIMRYWGEERFYHHTAPINMLYAFNEALRIIDEEGLHHRWARHRRNAEALWAGLEAMGLDLPVAKEHRLPSLTCLSLPEGIEDGQLRRELMERYSIEVGAGLGELKGKVIRIGLMGSGSTANNVIFFLSALGTTLNRMGWKTDVGAALETADERFRD